MVGISSVLAMKLRREIYHASRQFMAAVFFRALYRSIMRALHKIRVRTSSGGVFRGQFLSVINAHKECLLRRDNNYGLRFLAPRVIVICSHLIEMIIKSLCLAVVYRSLGPSGICNYKTPSKLLFSLVVWIRIGKVLLTPFHPTTLPISHPTNIAGKRYMYHTSVNDSIKASFALKFCIAKKMFPAKAVRFYSLLKFY